MKTRFLAFFALAVALAMAVQRPALAAVCATIAGASLMPREGLCMAAGPLNLLDIALRSGKGVHAVLEGVLTYAPELMVIPTLTKPGLTYTTLTCTELPSGDFRQVGGGVGITKSAWKKEVGSMAAFEAQMRVPEDIVIAARAENDQLTEGDILATEAIRTLRGSTLRIGAQVWYGLKISADGFAGLCTQVDAANDINAGAAANVDSSSVYLVHQDNSVVNNEGVHFVLGNGGRMQFSDLWLKQQIALASDPAKFFNAYTNNFLSYLGLVVPRPQAVYRVRNVDAAHPFTDALASQLLAKVPVALKQDRAKWKWFMNSQAQFGLATSRATVAIATGGEKGVGASGVFPADPTSAQGIAIQLTDSLLTTERAGVKP